MYLMYIDESGDTGTNNSPTDYFVLSAMVVHEEKWLDILDDLIVFRRYLNSRYGLRMKEEIHAAEWLNKNPNLRANIQKNDRLDILKKCLKWLDQRNDISIFSVRCNKTANASKDIFVYTWKVLIQGFEHTLFYNNFPGGNTSDKGIVIPDDTHGEKLTNLLREMRQHNFMPNVADVYGTTRLRSVIEDPVMRNSSDSYFHQMIDVVAFFTRMYYEPNRYVRRKGARTFVRFIDNVMNPHIAKNTTLKGVEEV